MSYHQIKKTLQDTNKIPKKSLGQNYLHDQTILEKITKKTLEYGIHIIEVGSGLGALTHTLLKAGAYVHAFEIEKKSVEFLESHLKSFIASKKLFIYHTDFTLATPSIIQNHTTNSQNTPNVIVGNLPYYLTSKIIFHALEAWNCPHLIFMMQHEVANRIMAKLYTTDSNNQNIAKDYSRITLSINYFCKSKISFIRVPPNAFYPPPKVLSEVVILTKKNSISNGDYPIFKEIVKQAFHIRRKKIIGLTKIKKLNTQLNINQLKQVLISLNLTEKRAPEISFNEYIQITKEYLYQSKNK